MYTDLLRFFFACLTWGPRDTKLWTRYLLKSIQFGSGCGVLLSSHGHIYISPSQAHRELSASTSSSASAQNTLAASCKSSYEVGDPRATCYKHSDFIQHWIYIHRVSFLKGWY